jgi:hypothetical protein
VNADASAGDLELDWANFRPNEKELSLPRGFAILMVASNLCPLWLLGVCHAIT